MVQLQVLTSAALQNVTQDCYFLLHGTVTSLMGKNLQPARMLRMKVPKFKCLLVICGLFRELVFVHCAVFQLSAMKAALVPAGPGLLRWPG